MLARLRFLEIDNFVGLQGVFGLKHCKGSQRWQANGGKPQQIKRAMILLKQPSARLHESWATIIRFCVQARSFHP